MLKSLIQSGESQSVADIDGLMKGVYKETLKGILET